MSTSLWYEALAKADGKRAIPVPPGHFNDLLLAGLVEGTPEAARITIKGRSELITQKQADEREKKKQKKAAKKKAK